MTRSSRSGRAVLALALGIERPDFVLPERYAFYLQFRRPQA